MIDANDRNKRHAEFMRLFAELPGPKRIDRVRQAREGLRVASECYVRRCLMHTPDRVPTWRSLGLMREWIERSKG